jgi:hypothetical protein
MNNTLDESSERLVAFRSAVPSPSPAQLAAGRDRLLAAARTEAGKTGVRRRAGRGPFPRWRPAVALAAAGAVAAVAVGAGYALSARAGRAGQPTGMTAVTPHDRTRQVRPQATLAAKVLRDAARVAAKSDIREPSPGQWIFSESVQAGYRFHAALTSPPEWITFDGGQTAYHQGPDGNGPLVVHTNRTSFPPAGANLWAALTTYGISPKIAWDLLDSLPANPRALLAVIGLHAGAGAASGLAAGGALFGGGKPTTKAQTEFDYLTWLMWNAQSGLGGPPAGDAAAYSALAALPGISVQAGITDAAGAPAIGVSADGGYNQLLLSPATYQVIGLRSISTGVAPKRTRYIGAHGAHGAYPPKGAVILSTAFTQETEVPAAGDR